MALEKVKVRDVLPRIVHLEFPDQKLLVYTLLRFEEYHEGSFFKGKVFTFDEFKEWQTRKNGRFTYIEEWSGFNIPSSVLKPFREGRFDPLSEEEKEFLEIFEGGERDYYIICSLKDDKTVFEHEMAHGLFNTSDDYRKRVMEILKEIELEEVWSRICLPEEHDKSVMEDEVQAYLVGDFEWIVGNGLNREKYLPYHERLRKIFDEYVK